jgi:hypothetical protein
MHLLLLSSVLAIGYKNCEKRAEYDLLPEQS